MKDACTYRIVGYSVDAWMNADLAVAAMRNAVALRDPAGTIVHSGRGSQFRSHAYVRALRGHGLVGSIGRVGACPDNAAMEPFFALLQKNVVDRKRWQTRDELRLANHHLDGRDLPPSTATRPPRTAHPSRARSVLHTVHASMKTTNPTSEPEWGQSLTIPYDSRWNGPDHATEQESRTKWAKVQGGTNGSGSGLLQFHY